VFGTVIVNVSVEAARTLPMVVDDGASGRVAMIADDFDDRIMT
jgi:hypothetical protein